VNLVQLTTDQLRRLFEPESKIKTWKDLHASWPERTIRLYVPDEESGTFDFFTEVVNGRAGVQRSDIERSKDDGTLVNDIAGDPDGLGYFGFAYFAANKADLRAVPIQDGEGDEAVEPSLPSILAGRYHPLGRPLFIYVKTAALARPEVADFVRYYLEHIQDLTTQAGYVPPSEANLAENARALEAVVASASTSGSAVH
jgi:phosphate transport system substrate-binding protein